jgi:hypothetical protein
MHQQLITGPWYGFPGHKVPKFSGSLAYRTVFSMAPLLIVITCQQTACRNNPGRGRITGSIGYPEETGLKIHFTFLVL